MQKAHSFASERLSNIRGSNHDCEESELKFCESSERTSKMALPTWTVALTIALLTSFHPAPITASRSILDDGEKVMDEVLQGTTHQLLSKMVQGTWDDVHVVFTTGLLKLMCILSVSNHLHIKCAMFRM